MRSFNRTVQSIFYFLVEYSLGSVPYSADVIDRAASHYSVSSEIRYYPAKLFDCFGSPIQQRGLPRQLLGVLRVHETSDGNHKLKAATTRPPIET
jgi:hypothetical protein